MEFTLCFILSAFLHTEFTGQSMPVELFRPSRASSFLPFILCHTVLNFGIPEDEAIYENMEGKGENAGY